MKFLKILLLIIKIKNIYEFNVLMLIYGCFPQKIQVTFVIMLSPFLPENPTP